MKRLKFPGCCRKVWVLKNKSRFDETKPDAFDIAKRKLILGTIQRLMHQSEDNQSEIAVELYKSKTRTILLAWFLKKTFGFVLSKYF
jgi:hypothetical protein